VTCEAKHVTLSDLLSHLDECDYCASILLEDQDPDNDIGD
jgi:hypothetical protein